jgi:uncharacterized protein
MMVYMHKTTRGAEKLFSAFLCRLAGIVKQGDDEATLLKRQSRLARFLASSDPSLRDYLALDDSVAWAELSMLQDSTDSILRNLAERLCQRRLYKCFDLGARLDREAAEGQQRKFVHRVRSEFSGSPDSANSHYLLDDARVTPYKWYDFEGGQAFQKVLVQRDPTEPDPVDIGHCSTIIKALRDDERISRLYVPTDDDFHRLERMWRDIHP